MKDEKNSNHVICNNNIISRNGFSHGKGKLVHPPQFTYEGDFFEDYMHGQGKQVWNFGESYEGEFAFDNYDGLGIYIWESGRKSEGVWKEGEFMESKPIK